jgi:hypothetical protein
VDKTIGLPSRSQSQELQMKRIIFIQHAADRLKERGIPVDLVEETIRNPDKIDLKMNEKSRRNWLMESYLGLYTKKRKL